VLGGLSILPLPVLGALMGSLLMTLWETSALDATVDNFACRKGVAAFTASSWVDWSLLTSRMTESERALPPANATARSFSFILDTDTFFRPAPGLNPESSVGHCYRAWKSASSASRGPARL
jgi:hypothetical protein